MTFPRLPLLLSRVSQPVRGTGWMPEDKRREKAREGLLLSPCFRRHSGSGWVTNLHQTTISLHRKFLLLPSGPSSSCASSSPPLAVLGAFSCGYSAGFLTESRSLLSSLIICVGNSWIKCPLSEICRLLSLFCMDPEWSSHSVLQKRGDLCSSQQSTMSDGEISLQNSWTQQRETATS